MNTGATAPDWGSVDLTVLPTITVAKGGTNIASFTEGDILYATGATTLAKLAKGTESQTLKMNSGATAPEWTTVAAATSDFVKIATTTLSSDTQYIEFQNCFSATYDRYMLIGDNIKTDQQEMRDFREENPLEVEASSFNLNYVKLDGNVGCIVNGAGLAMATMDII